MCLHWELIKRDIRQVSWETKYLAGCLGWGPLMSQGLQQWLLMSQGLQHACPQTWLWEWTGWPFEWLGCMRPRGWSCRWNTTNLMITAVSYSQLTCIMCWAKKGQPSYTHPSCHVGSMNWAGLDYNTICCRIAIACLLMLHMVSAASHCHRALSVILLGWHYIFGVWDLPGWL